jgi:hypothetical protein
VDSTKKGYEKIKRMLRGHVPLFYGCEVKTNLGEVVGYFLNNPVREGNFFEVVEEIKDSGGVVSVPHPFDFFRRESMKKISKSMVKKIDCIEVLNSRSLFGISNIVSSKFAKENKLACVGGSDAHTKYELGNCYTVIDGRTEDKIIREIKRKRTKVIGRQNLPLVHLVTIAKKYLLP